MDNEKLKKRSKQGALTSSIGFLIVIAAFAFASWKLTSLNTVIQQKTIELGVIIKAVDSSKIKQLKFEQIIEEQERQSSDLEDQLLEKNKNISLLINNVQLLDNQADIFKQKLIDQQNLVSTLNEKIKKSNHDLSKLTKDLESAQNDLNAKLATVKLKEQQILTLNIELKKLESEKKAYTSFLDKYSNNNISNIIPKATSTKIGKYYNFKIWLDIPANQQRKINEVTYFFNHSSFKNPKVVVKSPSSSFNTGYTGWGCLGVMPITITFNDGKEETIVFKMCEYINDNSIPKKGIGIVPKKGE